LFLKTRGEKSGLPDHRKEGRKKNQGEGNLNSPPASEKKKKKSDLWPTLGVKTRTAEPLGEKKKNHVYPRNGNSENFYFYLGKKKPDCPV